MNRAINEQALPAIPAGFVERIIAVASLKPERRVMNSYLIACFIVVILFVVLSGFILSVFQTRLSFPVLHLEKTGFMSLPGMVIITGAIGFVYICINGFRRYDAKLPAFGDLSL